jgi:pyridoxine kinase
VILVTSLHTQETPHDAVDLLASDRKTCFRLRTPRLPQKMNGAGDAIAALFFAHYLRSDRVGEALSNAASALFGVLAKTAEAGAAELALIAGQGELVNPSRTFAAQELPA